MIIKWVRLLAPYNNQYKRTHPVTNTMASIYADYAIQQTIKSLLAKQSYLASQGNVPAQLNHVITIYEYLMTIPNFLQRNHKFQAITEERMNYFKNTLSAISYQTVAQVFVRYDNFLQTLGSA